METNGEESSGVQDISPHQKDNLPVSLHYTVQSTCMTPTTLQLAHEIFRGWSREHSSSPSTLDLTKTPVPLAGRKKNAQRLYNMVLIGAFW